MPWPALKDSKCLRLVIALVAIGAARLPADEGVREVQLESLRLRVPGSWKQQPPANRLRLGQFEIAAVEGDTEPGELTVFNFGIGGGVQANVDRWIGQFEAEGRAVAARHGRCPQGEYVLVDIAGTYKKPIGPPIQQRTEAARGYRMLGVILATDQRGHYFLKLVGPDKTTRSAAGALRASLGANDKDEKPYEFKQPE